jgi:hypothetical protein
VMMYLRTIRRPASMAASPAAGSPCQLAPFLASEVTPLTDKPSRKEDEPWQINCTCARGLDYVPSKGTTMCTHFPAWGAATRRQTRAQRAIPPDPLFRGARILSVPLSYMPCTRDVLDQKPKSPETSSAVVSAMVSGSDARRNQRGSVVRSVGRRSSVVARDSKPADEVRSCAYGVQQVGW